MKQFSPAPASSGTQCPEFPSCVPPQGNSLSGKVDLCSSLSNRACNLVDLKPKAVSKYILNRPQCFSLLSQKFYTQICILSISLKIGRSVMTMPYFQMAAEWLLPLDKGCPLSLTLVSATV